MYLREKRKFPPAAFRSMSALSLPDGTSLQLQCMQQQIFRHPPCHSTKRVNSSPHRLMSHTYGGESSVVSLSDISDEAGIHRSYTLPPQWREKLACPRSVELIKHDQELLQKPETEQVILTLIYGAH